MNKAVYVFAAVLAVLLVGGAIAAPSFDHELIEKLGDKGGASHAFSPYAVSQAIGVLADGMDNREVRMRLGERMGLMSTEFGVAFGRLNEEYESWALSNGVRVASSMSLWLRNYSRIEKAFHVAARRNYGMLFGPLQRTQSVNTLTSVRTDGLVENVLEDFGADCNGAFISAVGFDGVWERPFPAVVDGTFHAASGDAPAKMLKDLRRLRALKRPDYTAFALPYRGGMLQLYVFLPEHGRKLADVWSRLTTEELDVVDRALLVDYHPLDSMGDVMPRPEGTTYAVTRLSMPEFRVDSAIDLKPLLADLNIPLDGYSAICKDMSLGLVRHRTVFAVSRMGAEIVPSPPEEEVGGEVKDIVCDRPFAFVVRTVSRKTLIVGQYAGR